ncbi:hypothetical protein SO802_002731 [Lithocarpus litseifolius]|uniref:DUF4283 domain-containing protein n=1 Tax=Lithocarpus litseifolius TaxID=425828 RepID=A0AAW2E0P0_9ROSI
METEVHSDDEESDPEAGVIALNLSGVRKASIRAKWMDALIVKVVGKTMGYQSLISKLMALWKPSGRLVCIALAVWVHLPELPIEYYKPLVLQDLGKAIGPILIIDTHTAPEAHGRFARLCVQVNFDKPLVKLLKVGGVKQLVQYEGISALFFFCGRIRHKVEGCLFTTRVSEKTNNDGEVKEMHAPQDHSTPIKEAYGPWVLVSRKRHASKKGNKDAAQPSQVREIPKPLTKAPAQSANPIPASSQLI